MGFTEYDVEDGITLKPVRNIGNRACLFRHREENGSLIDTEQLSLALFFEITKRTGKSIREEEYPWRCISQGNNRNTPVH